MSCAFASSLISNCDADIKPLYSAMLAALWDQPVLAEFLDSDALTELLLLAAEATAVRYRQLGGRSPIQAEHLQQGDCKELVCLSITSSYSAV